MSSRRPSGCRSAADPVVGGGLSCESERTLRGGTTIAAAGDRSGPSAPIVRRVDTSRGQERYSTQTNPGHSHGVDRWTVQLAEGACLASIDLI